MKKVIAALLVLVLSGIFILSFLIFRLTKELEGNGVATGTSQDEKPRTVPPEILDPNRELSYADYLPPPFPGTGIVQGKLCYPSEGIPPLDIYVTNPLDSTVGYRVETVQNQPSYEILDVTPGEYIAFAWVKDMKMAGSYSPAVPCGLTASCTDHKPLRFMVTSGEYVQNIDICDWYGLIEDVPPRPSPN